MAGGSTWPGSGCGTSFDKSETVLARSAPEIAAQPPGHRADGERAKAHADLHRSGVNAKCGHSLLQGLESVTETLANPFWSQRLALVQHDISAGKPVWLALKNSGEFSPLCIQLVRTGEASGSLDAMLRNLAHHHGEKTTAQAENLAALLEPALLVITGLIIGTLVVAMYLPIFHLGDAMSGVG